MSEKFIINLPEGATETDMQPWAEAMKLATGADVRLVTKLVFEVDDEQAAKSISKIVDLLQPQKPAGNGHKPQKAAAVPEGMSRASYRFIDTGSVFSTQALNKWLKANDDVNLPGRRVENYRGQKFVIMDIEGSLSLVKEPRE